MPTNFDKVLPRITLPLAPLLHPGEDAPRPSKRLRPEDVLDLYETRRQLAPSILATIDIDGAPWSVISVYSPYSPDIHVMIMETSTDRIISGPEAVPLQEGDSLMKLWKFILEFIAGRQGNESIYVGYNWSPRAWGGREERGGFQSVPTKWHAMLWGWPAFPEKGKCSEIVDWIRRDELSLPARRIFGENEYTVDLSNFIHTRLRKLFEDRPEWHIGWDINNMGLKLELPHTLPELLSNTFLFSQIISPVAIMLDRLYCDMTHALTHCCCSDIDSLIARLVSGEKDETLLAELRKPPKPRKKQTAFKRFLDIGGSRELFDSIYPAVKNRYYESEPDHDWWRKGFGYSWSLSGGIGQQSSICRILPGVYVGPGGVVEAQGVLLHRPLDRHLPKDTLRKKSEALWALAAALKSNFKIIPESYE
ncbi:hypothetical protein KAR48_14470 [bacterium]|nr:hypothetical protein [bacterium]